MNFPLEKQEYIHNFPLDQGLKATIVNRTFLKMEGYLKSHRQSFKNVFTSGDSGISSKLRESTLNTATRQTASNLFIYYILSNIYIFII